MKSKFVLKNWNIHMDKHNDESYNVCYDFKDRGMIREITGNLVRGKDGRYRMVFDEHQSSHAESEMSRNRRWIEERIVQTAQVLGIDAVSSHELPYTIDARRDDDGTLYVCYEEVSDLDEQIAIEGHIEWAYDGRDDYMVFVPDYSDALSQYYYQDNWEEIDERIIEHIIYMGV